MKLNLVSSAREKITKNIVWLLMKIIINLVFPKDYIIQQGVLVIQQWFIFTISLEMNLIQRIIRYFTQGLILNVLGGNLERALTFVKLDLLD